MSQTIQLRNGTAAAWTSANTLLALGEVGVETDTHKLKIGDGVTPWNTLAYSAGGTGSTTFAALTDAVTATIATTNISVANALATKGVVGLVGINAVDTTASRTLSAADFDGSILRLNSASSIIITIDTIANMGITATAGQGRVKGFHCLGGGTHSFAAATGVTITNRLGTLVTGDHPVIEQDTSGGNTWTIF